MDQTLLDRRLGESHEQRVREAQAAAEAGSSAWRRVTDAADRLGDEAARDLERAKGGLSKLGRAGVDIAEKAIELGFDTGVGYLSGGMSKATRGKDLATAGSRIIPQIVRTFGAAAQEAKRNGASLDEQVLSGPAKSGVEGFTHILFNVMERIPDKRNAYVTMQKTVNRLAKSQTGTVLLKAMGSGAEEAVQSLLEPFIKQIYQEDIPMAENSSNIDPADILYAALIGFTVGMLESGAETAKGYTR